MRRYDEKKGKKILASVLMGFNCLNSLMPIGVTVPKLDSKAQADNYTATYYQMLNAVDSVVFSTAEASFSQEVNNGQRVANEVVEKSATTPATDPPTIVSVQTVYGGTALNTTVGNGGTQIVSGGTVHTSTWYPNGKSAIVNSGGVVKVYGGGVNYLSLGTGAEMIVSGGSAWVNSGFGTQNVYGGSGGIGIAYSGGTQNVYGGYGRVTWLEKSGGVQNVYDGTAYAGMISSGGLQNVYGGTVVFAQVFRGGTQIVNGGSVTSVKVGYNNEWGGVEGGTQIVNGGSVTSVTIANNGQEIVQGGTVIGSLVNAGGTQTVNGGTTSNTIVGANFIYPGWEQNSNGEWEQVELVKSGGIQTVNGGTAIGNTVSSGGRQNVSGGTATNNTISSGGSQTLYGGTAISNLIQSGANQILSGGTSLQTVLEAGANQIAYSGTIGGVTIGEGSDIILHNDTVTLGDVDMTGGRIVFGADGGNYNITGTFNFNGGLVDMTVNPDGALPNPRTYESLTIGNLAGNGGTFKMDTDLDSAVYGSETTYGDKLVVNDGNNGTYYVQVVDKSLYTGTEITGDRKLELITDNSNNQNFTAVGKDLNNGGVWFTHAPELFKEGNKWYIGYIKKEATNDTTVILKDRLSVYNQWSRLTNDTLRKRMGDLRYNEADSGVWVRVYGGQLDGDAFTQKYHAFQGGIDKKFGNTTYGIGINRLETDQEYTYGTGEGTTTAGMLYATQYTDTGSYWDVIGQYGKINTKYNTHGDFPDKADYDSHAWSLSAEYGKTNRYAKGFFVEPKVQLTYGSISGQDYLTNRNTEVNESRIKSLIGRLGVTAGRQLNKDTDYYVKLSWLKEFKGDRDVALSAANGEHMYYHEDYGDNWFELGLGGNVRIGRKTHVYGDIERSLGASVQKKWQLNAGVRFEF